MSLAVIWHDLECGSYEADLDLWRDMAATAGGPVLDIGAGTGRVALDLARRGHNVVALDIDDELLEALRNRSQGCAVEVICDDGCAFALGRRFALVLVPMQTIQLLRGAQQRTALLTCARDHLAPGGTMAIAIADALEGYDADHDVPPVPDVCEIDGALYSTRPVRVVDNGEQVLIERQREIVDGAGTRSQSTDVVRLARVTARELESEGRSAGLTVRPRLAVAATDEYVGSTVVIFGG